MSLPAPAPRRLSHTRTVVFQGYDREDGLWDIEATLTDVKPYTFQVPNEPAFPADEPIHGLSIRLTIDNDMLIHDVATSLDHIPHAECSQGPMNMHKLKGCRMGKGWRKTIDEKVGGLDGCTHLREMLFNMATAAFQTLPSGQWHRRELAGQPHPVLEHAPFHLGHCVTWAFDSPTVARAYPMFYKPRTPAAPNSDN